MPNEGPTRDLTPQKAIGRYRYTDGWMAHKTFPSGRDFIVVIAGAYDAGIVGSEVNGIAILDDNFQNVVLDEHIKISSGWLGPSDEQKAEYHRILAMDWDEFRAFVAGHKRYRGSVPDLNMPEPMSIAGIADREIFPASAKPAENPYSAKMPLTGRRDIIKFLTSHSVHEIGRSGQAALAWDIKVRSFDHSGRHEGFEPDAAFDERWQAYLEANNEMFWNEAADALSEYTGGYYTMWEGESAGTFTFGQTGRSGGWLVLTGFNNRKDNDLTWRGQKELEVWLDELEDDEIVQLYKLVTQVDQDTSDPGAEMAYRYATRRRDMEEEWQAENAPHAG